MPICSVEHDSRCSLLSAAPGMFCRSFGSGHVLLRRTPGMRCCSSCSRHTSVLATTAGHKPFFDFPLRSTKEERRTQCTCPPLLFCMTSIHIACIDADVVVPGKFFPKEEWAARTIRQNGRISASMVIWTPIAATYYSASTSAPMSSASASSSTMTAWPGSRISISRWPSMACT